ncbi:Polyisoprenoid-binding protein YceI [Daejeonella lutea]|uniref:Polyisoprenoid-binding protein YceI n=1 Tax=Daejeonella lutea TaxID=572036 RepID=A0A1T5CWZ9_9SPHI|nr:Polyisoprenoid-binding protein YceI [Daejeonella lutea]
MLQSLAATSQTFHVSKADISVTGTAREKSWSMKTNTAQGSANLLFKDGKLAQVRSLNLSIPVGELKSDNPRMDARAYKGLKMYPYDRIRFAGKTMKLSGSGTGSYRLFTEGNLQIAGITQVAILLVDIQVNNDGTLTGRGTTEIKRSDFDIRLLAAEEAVMSLSDVIRVDFQLTLSRIGN